MRTLLLIITSLFFICCSRNDDHNNVTFSYDLILNSSINTDSINTPDYLDIGEKIVFRYHKATDPDPKMADEESIEILIFEIEDIMKEFEFCDDKIKQINCFYYAGNVMILEDFQAIEKGCIEGTKISATEWEVDVNILTPSSGKVQFKKKFQVPNHVF